MGRYSPWRHLRSLEHIELIWTDDDEILAGADARYFHTVSVIVMDKRIESQAERRSVLCHEIAHVLRGDLPTGSDVLDAKQEAHVTQWAARQLIELPALLDALRWSMSAEEAADELWVSGELLEVRLAHLHPAERAWLNRALQDGGPGDHSHFGPGDLAG